MKWSMIQMFQHGWNGMLGHVPIYHGDLTYQYMAVQFNERHINDNNAHCVFWEMMITATKHSVCCHIFLSCSIAIGQKPVEHSPIQ